MHTEKWLLLGLFALVLGIGCEKGQPPPDLLKALKHATSDKDPRVRAAVVQALTHARLAAVLETLQKHLSDPDELVALHAIRALNRPDAKSPALLARLHEMLGKRDAHNREICRVWATWKAYPALVQALFHEDASVHFHARQTLAKLGPKALPELLKHRKSPRVRRKEKLLDLLWLMDAASLPSLDPIRPLLLDPNARVRLAAFKVYKKSKAPVTPADLPSLRSNLLAPNRYFQKDAASVLPKMGKKAAAAMRSLLGHKRASVRLYAAVVLSKIGDRGPAVIASLQKMLAHKSYKLRLKATRTLGKFPPATADGIAAFVAKLDDDQAKVASAAIEALGRLGSKALAPVQKSLSSASERERINACRALAKMGPVARAAAPALRTQLQHSSLQVRSHAAQALGSIGALDALPALQALLKQPSDIVRRGAILGLGTLGTQAPKKTLSDLQKALKDPHESVRQAALQSLRQMGQRAKQLAPLLHKLLRQSDYQPKPAIVHALLQLGPESRLQLLQALPALAKDAHLFTIAFDGLRKDLTTKRASQLLLKLSTGQGLTTATRKKVEGLLRRVLKHKPEWVGPLLSPLLQDKKTARLALRLLPHQQALPLLPALLQRATHADEILCRASAELFRSVGEKGLSTLKQTLQRPTSNHILCALDGIAKAGSQSRAVGRTLVGLLGSKNHALHPAAARALGRLEPLYPQALRPLLRALKSPQWETRKEAAFALRRYLKP